MSMISRRKFLTALGAAGGAAMIGGAAWGIDASTQRSAPRTQASTSGPLVLITLYGGNDGLNTVIPYTDPAYKAARPNLGYDPSVVLSMADGLGLNPKLTGLHGLWGQGKLAVVRGVGYPNPNLSHFESMDIWQTANPVDGAGTGWLGRWLDATGTDPMRALSVGTTLPLALRGQSQSASAVTATSITVPGGPQFEKPFILMQAPGPDRTGLAAQIAGSGNDLIKVKGQLDALRTHTSPTTGPPTTASTPGSSSGAGRARPAAQGTLSASDVTAPLGIVASLINAGSPARVYQVSLGSFDTHADEKANQEKLLANLDQGITSFLDAVAANPAGRNAVLMTYSEFGRRPIENASGGTDHGTAAPLFVAGHNVKGGFYGEEPSLTRLDANGNLVFNVDFRSVYATVLEKVIGFDSKDVLGGTFPTLGFV